MSLTPTSQADTMWDVTQPDASVRAQVTGEASASYKRVLNLRMEIYMKATAKRTAIRKLVAHQARDARQLTSRIWELAEPPFQETGSARLLADYLAGRGFKVKFSIPSVPTAFKATWGKGKPVIGFLGEYDALPDCGLKKGTYGHGCGHNLLGVGAAVGVVVTARLLEAKKKPGRVVYWGCPAEEALAGKVYMARDGAFRGLDACLGWHPGGNTRVNAAGGSALDSIVFEFYGQTAHGAHAHGGRSALDAAILMDVAANYLREHVREHIRMHSVIRDGGKAPNVVPEYAKIWYYTRAKDRAEVDDITRRLTLCAKGAAIATETRLKVTKLTGCYSRLTNRPLAELIRDNLILMGAPRPVKADHQRVEELDKKPEFATGVNKEISATQGKGSSDEDNVSWLAPFGCFGITCISKDIRGHHREYTAQSNLPFAHRGMLRAGEVFAGIAWDLASDVKLLRRIQAKFKQATKGFKYDPLIPQSQRPPLEGV